MSSSSFIDKNILIRAGAGAGKTTRLIEEVYGFFLNHKKTKDVWPRIVLTTFSNKATQEINERLLKKAIEVYDVDFFEFINSKMHLMVSTIHGVLHTFISQNQPEFGLTKDFVVVNDSEIARRQQKLFRKTVMEQPTAVLLLDIFSLSELYALVTDYRFFKLTTGELKPMSQEVFKDYVAKLSKEITSDFQSSLGALRRGKLTDSWINALQNFPNIDDEQQSISNLLAWEETISLPRVSKKGDDEFVTSQSTFVNAIRKLREFRDRNYHEDFLDSFESMQTAFAELAENYFHALDADQKESQEISISDIETMTFQVLASKPHLFQEFSKKWDFWMIDEFQDTSPIQISLLNQLIGTSRSFFVGDPQQSIYYFRGSDSRVFDGKMNELKASGKVEVLDNNYRSYSGVLNFINEFFTRQYSQFQKMTPTKARLAMPHDVHVFEILDKSELAVMTARQIAKIIHEDPATQLENIVILSRTNKDLETLAGELDILHVPHYVHSQGQFFKQREILDLLFFVRFLIRPNDLGNLVYLFKTPLLGMNPDETKAISKDFISWAKLVDTSDRLSTKASSDIKKLDGYLKKSTELGLIETAQLFAVNEASFVLSHLADSSGKKESNMWKFFYWLRTELSRGMDSFLLQVDGVLDPDKNDTYQESESQAIIEPKKVQMMTIHASKGLQFSHVIVIGMHNPLRVRGRFVLDVDAESKEFSVFIKNKAKDDKIRSPIYWAQLALQKERETEEFERLFYVALTRAKERVSLFTLGKFSDSTWAHKVKDFYNQYLMNPESMSFVMSWESLDPSQILGDVFLKTIGIMEKVAKENSLEPTEARSFLSKLDNLMTTQEAAGPLSFSSSRGHKQSTLNQVIISQKGIELHHRREKGVFDFSYYPKLSLAIPIAQIFENGFREYRFTFQYGQFQIVGSMDFVYFGKDRVVIIDYKSGRSTQTELYSEQLKFYAQCVMHIKKLKPETVFDLVIDYVDQKKAEYMVYKPVPIGPYLDTFIQDRELENVVS